MKHFTKKQLRILANKIVIGNQRFVGPFHGSLTPTEILWLYDNGARFNDNWYVTMAMTDSNCGISNPYSVSFDFKMFTKKLEQYRD